jgi:hypothetical protein
MRTPVCLTVALLVLVAATGGHADPEHRQSAGEHFARGLELANAGGYESALREFNDAYAISPHFAVLYNIGQAQLALGHLLEAIEALSHYLQEGEDQIAPQRRAQVEAQIAQLRSRLAELSVISDRLGARIIVDGREVGRTPLRDPVRLVAGTHTVSAGVEGGAAVSRIVTLGEGERKELKLELASPPMAVSSAGPTGILAIRCDDPALQVTVDGASVDRERFTRGVPVATGPHRIRLASPGRRSSEQTLEVPSGTNAMVFCGAQPLAGSEAETFAQPGRSTVVPALGYVLGGTGVVLGGVALIQYAWNKRRFDDWRATQAELNQTPSTAEHRVRQLDNNDLADSIERASRVTVGLAVVGEVLLTTGVVLVLLGRGGKTPSAAPTKADHQRFNLGAGIASNGVITLNGSW